MTESSMHNILTRNNLNSKEIRKYNVEFCPYFIFSEEGEDEEGEVFSSGTK